MTHCPECADAGKHLDEALFDSSTEILKRPACANDFNEFAWEHSEEYQKFLPQMKELAMTQPMDKVIVFLFYIGFLTGQKCSALQYQPNKPTEEKIN